MDNIIKLLGIVITYFPNVEETKHNIQSYINDVDKLIIWENTPTSDRMKYRILLPEFGDKIIYMSSNENMYIAYPLNQAVKYGRENEFSHLLTMDQDSCFEEGYFKKYKELVMENSDNCSIFGGNPNFCDQPVNSNKPRRVGTLITSSSIFKMDIFEKIGLFREDYKIDCVDFEFCYRARQKQIYSYMINSILLHHKFGNLQKTKYGYRISNYSPVRLYFIAKNNIKLKKEYPDYINIKETLNRIFNPFFKIVISESNKWNKIVAICKGIYDGLFNK